MIMPADTPAMAYIGDGAYGRYAFMGYALLYHSKWRQRRLMPAGWDGKSLCIRR